MAFTGPLEDRIAIRELNDAYGDAGFRGDMDAWLDCFAEDCVWITQFGEMRGKEQLAGMWNQIWETMGALGFFTVMGAIEIDGDRARTRAYIREIFLAKDGSMQKLVGRYDDDLVRIDGIWKFSRRDYSVLIREGGD